MMWSPLQNGLAESLATDGCLSHFAMLQIAAGRTAPGVDEALHMASCASCRAHLVKERRGLTRNHDQLLTAARVRALPSPQARRRLRAWAMGAGLLVASAILLLRPVPPALAAAPRSLLFGEVSRLGGEPWHLAPLTSLQGMRHGDRLTVRVRVTEPMRAVLSVQDGGAPRIYFDGVLPGDGVLPATVEVTGEAPPHLRLDLCPLSQADTSCDSFDLK